MTKKRLKTGVEKVSWDLSCFYAGPNDPKIESDLNSLKRLGEAFRLTYKGRLDEHLGEAIRDFERIEMVTQKLLNYFVLIKSLDVKNEAVKIKSALVDETVGRVYGEFLSFFFIEVSALSMAKLKQLSLFDQTVARYSFWLEQIRRARSHFLKEDVEAAITKRLPFGSDAWVEFFDEMEDALNFEGQEFSEALKKYATQTLNVVINVKAIEDKERGYANALTERNERNGLTDAMVETLHRVVQDEGIPLVRRYFHLKKTLLRKKSLLWNDRCATPALKGMKRTRLVPFAEARETVLAAYESFSPTLANLIREIIKSRRIDATDRVGKAYGPYNCSTVLPGRRPISFTFLNYDGSHDDVLTLAHELGHATRGLLAGEAQGPLLIEPPLVLEETASAFGELLTFNYLRKNVIEQGNKRLLFRLLIEQIEESINTVVHQICLSTFERRLYETKKWFTGDELCVLWLDTLKMFYGKEGALFNYDGAGDRLFDSYIPRFYEPFYLYSYAFGELLTHGLYAQQKRLGRRFEPLYLNFLRAGRSQPLSKLLKPFRIDLTEPRFWSEALEISLGAMIKEAEDLARELGYKIPK
ncbi:MAG: M3 family metallopeptidase [Patescibacteria group bacterium]